jgi:hypothetical protein
VIGFANDGELGVPGLALFSAGPLLLAIMLAGCDPTIRLGAQLGAEAGPADATSDAPQFDDARAVAPDGDGARFDAAGFDAADAAEVDATVGTDAQGSILWSATFETGDFSEWTADGQGFEYGLTSSHVVTTDQAHSGTQSAKLTINPTNGNVDYMYLFRGGPGAPPAEPEAYYGAWFFIPQAYTESFYWNIFHFLQSATADRSSVTSIWDVNLRSNETGALVPYVYDFVARRQRDETIPTPVPTGRWFHLEVLLRVASTPTGRFALFQDGVLVLDATDIVTTSNPWIQWSVGSTSTDITPTPADLYIDDVTLSRPP